MVTRVFGRAGALVLVGSALGLALSGAPAQAQCVGDCAGDGEVTINDLILGVNISLGSAQVSACEAFANNEGEVTIAQLIQGVNNSLNGCPVVNTPTATVEPTPTATPDGGSGLGTHTCSLLSNPPPNVTSGSHLALNIAALPVPLTFPLNGDIAVSCGEVGAEGIASCTCEIEELAPVQIPNIGFVCISKSAEPCAPADIDCDGGLPLGVTVDANSNIGSCNGNAACSTSCDAHCAGLGSVQQSSGCTGYCSAGTEQACTTDEDCLPDNGACNGPDPVGGAADICTCQCINSAAGSGSRAGDFQCNLGSNLVVENAAPCGDGDVRINVGETCVAQTTGTASTIINNANREIGATIPASGVPITNNGTPVSCDNFQGGNLSGLKIRGVVNFFGSSLGDIATALFADCAPPQ